MTREELLRSKEYWMVQIQNDLYAIIDKYMQSKNLNRSDLARELDVTKGYVTQVLNGGYDHKISKLVDLTLASGNVPLLYFVNLEQFIRHDAAHRPYEIFSPITGGQIEYSPPATNYNPAYTSAHIDQMLTNSTSSQATNKMFEYGRD